MYKYMSIIPVLYKSWIPRDKGTGVQASIFPLIYGKCWFRHVCGESAKIPFRRPAVTLAPEAPCPSQAPVLGVAPEHLVFVRAGAQLLQLPQLLPHALEVAQPCPSPASASEVGALLLPCKAARLGEQRLPAWAAHQLKAKLVGVGRSLAAVSGLAGAAAGRRGAQAVLGLGRAVVADPAEAGAGRASHASRTWSSAAGRRRPASMHVIVYIYI